MDHGVTLDQFEALVFSQQPASQPWTPVTDYSLDHRRDVEGQHPYLIKDVFHPQLVIDAGCGPDGILVKLLHEIGVQAIGFDVQIPKTCLDLRFTHGDLCDPRCMASGERPFADLVVCREVLEHLTIRQIRQAVTNLCRMSAKYVYVTTRFNETWSADEDVDWMLDVQTQDVLDPTHITMLRKDFLRLLFVLEGFRRCPDLETRMDHQHKGRVLVYERV